MIKIENVSVTSKKEYILSDINLNIDQGLIVGLVGHNGAGKTTLLRAIGNEIKLNSGKVISSPKIGKLITKPSLYNNRTGFENIKFFSNIYGGKDEDVDNLINLFDIKQYLNKKVDKYSQGMKQLLAICIAFIGNPEIILLDEPTNGLDPAVRQTVLSNIKELAKSSNITVLISSHDLHSLEKVVDYSVYIKGGKIVYIDNQYDNYIVTIDKNYVSHIKEICEMNKIMHNIDNNNIYISEKNKNFLLQYISNNNINIENVKKMGIEDIYNEKI